MWVSHPNIVFLKLYTNILIYIKIIRDYDRDYVHENEYDCDCVYNVP